MKITEYPYMISGNYALISSAPTLNRQFRQIIRTFAATLKFLSITTLGEYLKRVEKDPDQFSNIEVDRFLSNRRNISHPSMGHFMDLFRRLVKASMKGKTPWLAGSSMAGLIEHVVTSGKKTGNLKSTLTSPIDNLIHTRNLFCHSDIIPHDHELEILIREKKEILDSLLDHLNWLSNGRLFLVREDCAYVCKGTLECCTEEDCLPQPEGITWEYDAKSIHMEPFLISKYAESSKPDNIEQVLQYETLQGKSKIKYLFEDKGIYIDDARAAKALIRLIDNARQRDPRQGKKRRPLGDGEKVQTIDWTQVVVDSAERSKDIIRFQTYNGKYNKDTYTPRMTMHNHLEKFLGKQEKRLLVIIGNSGCGKTNLVCRWTQDLLENGHAILHYYGRKYNGESFLDLLAKDLVWVRENLAGYLDACSLLDSIKKDNKRLLIIVDAVNEYSTPEILFRQLYKLIETRAIPEWIKIIITCRPVPWEHISTGFQVNWETTYFDESSPALERQPYLFLGDFTDPELDDAWEKWKQDKNFNPDTRLPEQISHLIRRPLLFRCFLDSIDVTQSSLDHSHLPQTPEEILIHRFEKLDAPSQQRTMQVAAAMWDSKTDFLSSDAYTGHKDLEEWIVTDQGADKVKLFGCPDEKDRGTPASPVEYSELVLTRPHTCNICGKKLVVVREEKLLPPLTLLRDESILSLYTVRDETGMEDELLRFTFDRMYEVLTGLHINLRHGDLDDAGRAISEYIKQAETAQNAAVTSAIKTAVLMSLDNSRFSPLSGTGQPAGSSIVGTDLLVLLSQMPANRHIQDFIGELLEEWAQRDITAVVDFTLDMLEASRNKIRKRQGADSGLVSAIKTLPILISEKSRQVRGPAAQTEVDMLLSELVNVAFDRKLTVNWEQTNELGNEQKTALRYTAPNNLCFQELLNFSFQECIEDRTHNVITLVRLMLQKCRGLVNLIRHRKRFKEAMNFLVSLSTNEVQNRALMAALIDEIKIFVSAVPLLGKQRGTMRSLVLHLFAKPIFSAINTRFKKMYATIPTGDRKYPDEAPPTINRAFHLLPEQAPIFRRFLDLFRDLDLDITENDLEHIREVARMQIDVPFRGLFGGICGSSMSQRSMQDVGKAILIAKKIVSDLDPDEEAPHPTTAVVWGILYEQRALTPEEMQDLTDLLQILIARTRKRVLSRYTKTALLGVQLSALPLSEIFREDGLMPETLRFSASLAASKDWAVLSRFWDQMLLTGIQNPKQILGYIEQILYTDSSSIRLVFDQTAIMIDKKKLDRQEEKMSQRYQPGFDPDEENCTPEIALLHLFGTIGSLELSFPKEVASYYRRNQISEDLKFHVRRLASFDSMQKLRDERLMNYFGNYTVHSFTALKHLYGEAFEMFYRDAEARDFTEPKNRDLVRLLIRILDLALQSLHEHK